MQLITYLIMKRDNLGLTDRNMQARICLKVVLKSLGLETYFSFNKQFLKNLRQ